MNPPAEAEALKILIVDDDQIDRELVRRTLQHAPSLNAQLTEVSSYDGGLTAVKESNFDLMLLDYIMPGQDGMDLLLALREERLAEDTAIIVMSNSEDDELALQCLRAGAQDFLLKSEITVSKLTRVVMQAQTRFRLEHAFVDERTRADTDTLTGVHNRARFEISLAKALEGSRREDTSLALMLLDLNKFKGVNDLYGHHVGDGLLKAVTERIRVTLRDTEVFGRLGGDEFALLITGLRNPDHAALVARRIVQLFESPFSVREHQITTNASIGIAIAPDNTRDPQELMRFADLAMYRAKAAENTCIAFFKETMRQEFLVRNNIEKHLSEAISNDEISVFYQPVYDANGKRIRGVEALARWRHEGEVQLPGYFMPVAESADLITRVGGAVIDRAIADFAQWYERDSNLFLALNLSSQQLLDSSTAVQIEDAARKHGIPTEKIELEFSQAALDCEPGIIRNQLIGLTALGFSITLENFGCDHSSITPLIDLPLKKVKIGCKMIAAIDEDEGDRMLAFLRGLKAMTDHIGLELAVAGIESEHQRAICEEIGFRYLQGFLLARPTVAEELTLQIDKPHGTDRTVQQPD